MKRPIVLSLPLLALFAAFHSAVGRAEREWWLTPHRMLQTNLREIDATMDLDRYVSEVEQFGADVVLFNVGGIVANYPTELEYHFRNPHMQGDDILLGMSFLKDLELVQRGDTLLLRQYR